jgi:hypothetical protein
MLKRIAALATMCVLLTGSSASALISSVYPPDKQPLGLSYPDWAEDWGRYAFGVPNKENPLIFATDCDVSIQAVDGAVMLPASGGGKQVVDCDVAKHTPLLITPGGDDTVVGVNGDTKHQALRHLRASLDTFDHVNLSIDGQRLDRVKGFLTSTPFFDIHLYKHNIVGAPEAGDYQMAIGGWFVMIRGLSQGDHVVKAHDEFGPPDDRTSATTKYQLHAVLPPLPPPPT